MFLRDSRPQFQVWRPVFALFLGLGCFVCSTVSALDLTQIKVDKTHEFTHVHIKVSDQSQASYFVLANPARLVVDLPRSDWKIANSSLQANAGLVKGVRFAHNAPKTSRLVFDLRGNARVDNSAALSGSGQQEFDLWLLPSAKVVSSKVQRFGSKQKAYEPAIIQARLEAATPMPLRKPQALAQAKPKHSPIRLSGAIAVPAYKPLEIAMKRKPVIILDPGHGGKDPGTSSAHGKTEKTTVLAVARELKRRLEASGNYEVHMTRHNDHFRPLRQRVIYGAVKDGDLFISIHADHHSLSKVRGATIYTLSTSASDRESKRVAARENAGQEVGLELASANSEVATTLATIGFQTQKNKADHLARTLVDHLRSKWPLHKRPIKSAGFKVLKSADVPSILVEIGYMSNPKDLALMNSAYDRRRLAGLLAKGIDAYFAE